MRPSRRLVTPLALALAAPAPVVAHGTAQGPPPTDLLAIALAWHVDPAILLGLAAAGGAYLAAVRSVDAAHPANRWPMRRTAMFGVGLLAVGVALLSPIDSLSDDLLTVHMVQHLLLTTVTPILFAASGIGTLALRVADRRTRERLLLPMLHSRVLSWLTFPVVGWVAFAAVMWGSHLSGLYDSALLDDGVHALEHLLYLTAASLLWWPLFSPDPLRWRLHPALKLLVLVAQMPPMSFLVVTIIGADQVLYPAYLGRPEAFGIDALADQRIAGSLMWLAVDATLLMAGLALVAAWFRHEEAETKRVDARLARARPAARKES